MLSATGVLKGYDALMNLVLDEVEELLRGENPPGLLSLIQPFKCCGVGYGVCVN